MIIDFKYTHQNSLLLQSFFSRLKSSSKQYCPKLKGSILSYSILVTFYANIIVGSDFIRLECTGNVSSAQILIII